MKKLNSNGFVLAETLVVTVFLMVIFSMIYSNFYPLIGEYEKREVYDDVDGKYSIYWIKKMIEDASYSITDENQKYNFNTYGYVRFECKDVSEDDEKRATCKSLVQALEVDGCDKNGNGCNIFITRYRLGGKDEYIFKNRVKTNLLEYQENCNSSTNNCLQKYITNCTKNNKSDNSEGECEEKAQKKVFRGGFKEYIEDLPNYSASSLNSAQFRVIASFKHREDNNNYYSYATTEIKRQGDKIEHSSFADDDWPTVVARLKSGDISPYSVGDEREVDLGTLGKHTIRIANTSTPPECEAAGFSQTACGVVLEFSDIITTHRMNSTLTNVGGWPASEMRTYVNNDIYNALPEVLRNAIIDTTVVSGHGSKAGETNFTSTDKLYLLSAHEVFKNVGSGMCTYSGMELDYYDTAYNNTRQLDYYKNLGVTTSNYSGAIKQYNGSNYYWWLRSAISSMSIDFLYVELNGHCGCGAFATNAFMVVPAFRIA